jgi:hypothetical protein
MLKSIAKTTLKKISWRDWYLNPRPLTSSNIGQNYKKMTTRAKNRITFKRDIIPNYLVNFDDTLQAMILG